MLKEELKLYQEACDKANNPRDNTDNLGCNTDNTTALGGETDDMRNTLITLLLWEVKLMI